MDRNLNGSELEPEQFSGIGLNCFTSLIDQETVI
jgi:hypothetical protein